MSSAVEYLVTGASGQLGSLVIESLLQKVPAHQIGALVRREDAAAPLREKGITVRLAGYDNAQALETAFQDVGRLLLISSSEVGQRAEQHANVIAAAKAANVGFIAYTSLLHADTSPLTILADEHNKTEDALAASNLHYALLRNGWYTENYVTSAGAAVEHGAVLGAAGDGRISSAARQDYAEAAAAVLTGSLPPSGSVYELAGDTSYTLADFAAKIAQQTGKPIVYNNLSQDDFASTLQQIGLPQSVAEMLANSDVGASRGGLFDDTKTLSSLIGRRTTPWQNTLKSALS